MQTFSRPTYAVQPNLHNRDTTNRFVFNWRNTR